MLIAAAGLVVAGRQALAAPMPSALFDRRAATAALSQSEIDLLVARLRLLWLTPMPAGHDEELRVVIALRLSRARRLLGFPVVRQCGTTPLALIAADAAAGALLAGQPYDMLRDESYEAWKEMDIAFGPQVMCRS